MGTDLEKILEKARQKKYEYVYHYFAQINNSQSYIAGMNIPLITFGRGVAHGQGACLLAHGGIACAARDQQIKFDDT